MGGKNFYPYYTTSYTAIYIYIYIHVYVCMYIYIYIHHYDHCYYVLSILVLLLLQRRGLVARDVGVGRPEEAEARAQHREADHPELVGAEVAEGPYNNDNNDNNSCTCICVYTHNISIHIYIYIERER